MAQRTDFQYLATLDGNDANDGHSWETSVATMTHILGMMNLANGALDMTVFIDEDQIVENMTIPNFGSLSILGSYNHISLVSLISGAADANPVFDFSAAGTLILKNVLLGSSQADKSIFYFNPGVGQRCSLSVKTVGALITTTGQRIINTNAVDGIITKFEEMIFYFFGGGPFTGSKYFYATSDINAIVEPLISNCTIIYLKTGSGIGLEETDIVGFAGGVTPRFRFYNCLWVEYDPIAGTYTIDDTPKAHPSNININYRDPKPLKSFGEQNILQYLQLQTLVINDGSGDEITEKTDIKGADDRDLTEVYDQIAAVSAGPQVSIDVPEKLIRPSAGSTIYRISINIYDSAGNPEAPDSAPTIKIMNRDESVTRVIETNMTQVVGQTGQYYYDYTITSITTLEKESIIIKLIEGGITTYHREVTEIYDEGSSGSGAGSVIVDHDYGGVDNYRVLRISTGAAIEGANLFMFTQADWNAGNRDTRSVHDGGNCRGFAETGSDGRWKAPMMLDPDTYILFVNDPDGEYEDSPVVVVVT